MQAIMFISDFFLWLMLQLLNTPTVQLQPLDLLLLSCSHAAKHATASCAFCSLFFSHKNLQSTPLQVPLFIESLHIIHVYILHFPSHTLTSHFYIPKACCTLDVCILRLFHVYLMTYEYIQSLTIQQLLLLLQLHNLNT